MGKPKRHHYLPQFYLEGFTRGELLWVADVRSGEFRRQPPNGTGVEKYFYSVETEEDERDASVEELLAELESTAAPAIRAAREGAILSDDQMADIKAFIAFLGPRTRAARDRARHVIDRGRRQLMRDHLGSEEGWAKLQREEPELVEGIGGREDFLNLLDSDGYAIEADQNFLIRIMFEQGLDLARDLARFPMGFLTPPDKKSFVTCDAPVLFAYPAGFRPDFDRTELPREAQVIAPLAQDLCAVLEMSDIDRRHFPQDADVVTDFNLKIAAHGHRYVLGPSKALLKSLVAARSRVSFRQLLPDDLKRIVDDDLRNV